MGQLLAQYVQENRRLCLQDACDGADDGCDCERGKPPPAADAPCDDERVERASQRAESSAPSVARKAPTSHTMRSLLDAFGGDEVEEDAQRCTGVGGGGGCAGAIEQ